MDRLFITPPSFKAVLAFVMSAKIHFPLEALGADLASERLESGVFAAVCDKVGALAEGLTAHLTFVRFLTCVYVGVFLHIRFLMKSLAAVLAGVRPSIRVNQKMGGQRRGAFESLPAHLALKTSFLRVDVHVLL